MARAPLILLVNPWITDFAAFDLWAKPLGLLSLAALLRQGGCGVAFVDCLDRHDGFTNHHPDVLPGVDRRYGTGKFPRMRIPKPGVYAGVPRHYHRYGLHPESFRRRLQALPKPTLIWVTSMMTYWYPGVVQAIAALREVFPDVPVWLGGVYARLCTKHAAEKSGADAVITLTQEKIPGKLEAQTGFALTNRSHWGSLAAAPPPALDLVPHLTYAPLLTSTGCPFHCPYCASKLLQPQWERRCADAVTQDIFEGYFRHGVTDFAFYDDALLIGAENSLGAALERVRRERLPIRFHTPNALHIRALTPEWCRLLYESGFTTLRLGLETTRDDRQAAWGGKAHVAMFAAAVGCLLDAGFSREQIGVYLLCGLPGQSPEEVAEGIRTVAEAGAQPHLAIYSPVPGTAMWPLACLTSGYPLEEEPLCHNNTFFACRRPDFSFEDLLRLKDLVRETRRRNAPA